MATSNGMRKSELLFNTLILPIDFVMLMLAGIVTYFSRTKILSSFRPVLFTLDLPIERYLLLCVLMSAIFIGAYTASGLYSLRYRRGLFEELSKIIVASSAGIMGLIVVIFLRQELFNSRFLVLGAWFSAIFFVSLGRLIMRRLQKFFVTRHDFGVHRVMVIGSDHISFKIVEDIQLNPHSGYRIFKHLKNPEIEEIRLSASNPGIDEVMLANPNYPAEKILQIVDFCHENHIIFKFVPNIYQTLTANFAMDTIGGVPLIELRRTALAGWGRVLKRAMDIILGTLIFILLLPFFAIMAIIIKLDSPGPVFVRLERISKNKKIYLWKFRSMVNNAESLKFNLLPFNERKDGPLFKLRNDPRITRVGRFIRSRRIDEFPQMINAIKGDLSLIGPRPHQPDEIQRYTKNHKRVLAIKAGVTGLAQISGSSDLPFEEEVALDTYYIENWSLWWDIKIILKTILKLFNDKSAV